MHPMTRLESEVLDTEKVFLRLGILPSVFFRFPGLVSDVAGLATLRRLGLIPLGAGAWLAKGEPAARGSVILVHGNGNEPRGIDRLLPLLAAGTRLLPILDAP